MNEDNFVIDRIEGDFVVAEDNSGCMSNIKIDNIVGVVKEGNILVKKGDYFEVDEKLTQKRKELINDLMKDMWK